MNYFTIHFGHDIDQAAICEKVKQLNGDCIQQSSGLIVKTPQEEAELKKELDTLSQFITISKLDPDVAQNDPSFSKDGKKFMENEAAP